MKTKRTLDLIGTLTSAVTLSEQDLVKEAPPPEFCPAKTIEEWADYLQKAPMLVRNNPSTSNLPGFNAVHVLGLVYLQWC